MNRRTRSHTTRNRQTSSPTLVHIPSSPDSDEPYTPLTHHASPQAGTSFSRPRPRTAGRGGSHSAQLIERAARLAEQDMKTDNLPDLVFPTTDLEPLDHYKRLKDKKFENTRVIDRYALEILGVSSDFYRLAGTIDIAPEFFHIFEPAYTRLTMEFLCSIVVRVD